jgi:Guanylate-kinase-associated protein (GKAP) protein
MRVGGALVGARRVSSHRQLRHARDKAHNDNDRTKQQTRKRFFMSLSAEGVTQNSASSSQGPAHVHCSRGASLGWVEGR